MVEIHRTIHQNFPSLRDLAVESPEALEQLQAANRRALWMRGNLRHLTRPHAQRRLYDAVHAHSMANPKKMVPVPWLCHRRLGKSFLLMLLCVERALYQPGADVKYACATRRQVKDIVDPMLGLILSTMPGKIQHKRIEHYLYFRLPHWPRHLESRIVFAGVDFKQGDLLRGQACDLVCLDEVREIQVLEYVMTQVLVPQFIGRPNPVLIMATTPPESMEHVFVTKYLEEGRRRGTAMVIPGSENEDFSREDKDMVVEEVGGEDSLAYQREVECKLIADTHRTVIPEFSDCAEYVVKGGRIERPEYYIPYISLDTGWEDHIGCLFAYLDFDRQKLVMIGEVFVQYKTTGEMSDLVRESFEAVFTPVNRPRSHWVADCNLQQLETLRRDHDLPFTPAQKHDRNTSLAQYRTALVEGRIEMEGASLPHTIRQHYEGIWNKTRKNFERSETMGHLDLISAAVYMHREVKWREMPSRDRARKRDGMWVSPDTPSREIPGNTEKTLTKLFGRWKRPR